MSANQYTCPSCATVLKTAAPVNPGTLIKCPKCTKVFPVPGAVAPKPATPAAPVAPRPVPPAAAPAAAPRPSVAPPAPAAAPRPAAPVPAAAPLATKPIPPAPPGATVPMPAPSASSVTAPLPAAAGETTAMPAAPRQPALLSRLPRKIRKYVVQGMGLAAGFAALLYFIFFLVAFGMLDGAVAKIKAPPGDNGNVAVSKPKKPLHLVYLSKDFTGIQTMRPDRLAKSSVLEGLPLEEMSTKSLEKSGIDPRKVDQIVTYFEAFPAGAPLKPGETAKWAEFTPGDGGFTATFPGKPKRSTAPRKLGSSEKMTVYQSRLSDAFLNKFSVEVGELGDQEVARGPDAAFQDDVSRAKFLSHAVKDITLDGNPGKEITNDAAPLNRTLTRKRIYLVGKRLVRVTAEGDKNRVKAEELNRFLDSFKLVPTKSDAGDEVSEFTDSTPFSWGVIVHFTEPTDGKEILKKALEDTKEITFEGKTYLRSQKEKMDGVAMCGHLPDEQTLLLAPEPTLRKMLSADETKSLLTERLGLLDVDSPFSMVFVMEPYSVMVAEGMRGVKTSVPPQLGGLKPILEVPERAKAFALTIDPDSEILIKVTAETADTSTATESAKGVQQGFDAAKGLYALFGKDALRDKTPADLREPLLKTIDSMLEGVKIETDGKNVVMAVKRPEGLDELLKKARPLLKEQINKAN